MAIPDAEAQAVASERTWVAHLRDMILRRVWYVHSGRSIRLQLTPLQSYQALETAARPSVTRLQLRHAFARGRRYFLRHAPNVRNGFEMVTTSKRPWYPRGRTEASAVLLGEFEVLGDQTTLMKAQVRIRTMQVLRVIPLPLFMASMIVFMPWGVWINAGLIGVLFWLSWVFHWVTAVLEGHEMIVFIEKALEDHIPEPMALPAPADPETEADVVMDPAHNFADAWEKFTQEMRD